MKQLFVILCLGLGILPGRTQEYELDLGKAVDLANDWAVANIDQETLKALGDVDRERVEKFLMSFQRSLQGSNVLQLAQFRAAATNIIPILAAYEETSPYASWLKSRLDYFEVSEELQRNLPKPPPRAQVPAASVVNIERT